MAMRNEVPTRTQISRGSRSFTPGSEPDRPTSTTFTTIRGGVNREPSRVGARRDGYLLGMAEFEAERGIPAAAERVFAVVSNLGRLPDWLPSPVTVRPPSEGEGH